MTPRPPRGRPRALDAGATLEAHILLAEGIPRAVIAERLGCDRTTLWRALTAQSPKK